MHDNQSSTRFGRSQCGHLRVETQVDGFVRFSPELLGWLVYASYEVSLNSLDFPLVYGKSSTCPPIILQPSTFFYFLEKIVSREEEGQRWQGTADSTGLGVPAVWDL